MPCTGSAKLLATVLGIALGAALGSLAAGVSAIAVGPDLALALACAASLHLSAALVLERITSDIRKPDRLR